jgi:hypothetical protein
MISTATMCRSKRAGIQSISRVFREYRDDLEWLANFLTGDEKIAAVCVIDACALAESRNLGLEDWSLERARLATMRSAVEIQRSRIAQLSQVYLRRSCIHGGHTALSQDSLELVMEESSVLVTRLDLLCRFALAICGIEKYSVEKAATFLGIDRTGLEGAYCAALQFLEVMGCEQFRQQNYFAAVCN